MDKIDLVYYFDKAWWYSLHGQLKGPFETPLAAKEAYAPQKNHGRKYKRKGDNTIIGKGQG